MHYNKINSKPPKGDNVDKATFINSANDIPHSSIQRTQSKSLPWEDERYRDDVKKAFTVALPEKYVVKLQYIKEKTNQSQQKVVREAICKEVDNIINALDLE